MRDPPPQLTVDQAMAEFQTTVSQELGDAFSSIQSLQTPQEAEENRFRFAEYMLRLACPDPRGCTDPRCRRLRLCRHFERVQAKRTSGQSSHSRRTPGAEAARYAVWVYMNIGR